MRAFRFRRENGRPSDAVRAAKRAASLLHFILIEVAFPGLDPFRTVMGVCFVLYLGGGTYIMDNP